MRDELQAEAKSRPFPGICRIFMGANSARPSGRTAVRRGAAEQYRTVFLSELNPSARRSGLVVDGARS